MDLKASSSSLSLFFIVLLKHITDVSSSASSTGVIEDVAPLARSFNVPDLHLQQPIKKKPFGDEPIMVMVDTDAERERDGDGSTRRRGDDEVELKPPLPLPSQRPPPSRFSQPETKPKAVDGGFHDLLFGSPDNMSNIFVASLKRNR
ncbi:hypothetical protein E2562_006740 [Oryza meyeriana var. granulata]|uniref:Uncharacterized protein n=1 Tax=Oryza meyeriana var. granulata TaxID=110450 RepID=A0A6G1EH95_9ORYZ|nr:hypothetical protein E2562_006740 [Oryza meyeriana var. granulata]